MNLVPGPEFDKVKHICVGQTKTGMTTIDDHLRPKWDRPRAASMILLSNEPTTEGAAQEAFQELNIGESRRTKGFRGPSLSVGDVVEIHDPKGSNPPQKALCLPSGWEFQSMGKTLDPEKMPTVEIGGEPWNLEINLYKNKTPHIRLRNAEGAPMTPSINIPEAQLPKNHVIIKNCDENTGLAKKLEDAGVGTLLGEQDGMALMQITHPAVLKEIEAVRAKVLGEPKKPGSPEMN